MQGSKYVQSDIVIPLFYVKGTCGKDGTSCLADAMPSCRFATLPRQDHEKLITMDIVCHGVPSPALFREYIRVVSRSWGRVTSYRFRTRDRKKVCLVYHRL